MNLCFVSSAGVDSADHTRHDVLNNTGVNQVFDTMSSPDGEPQTETLPEPSTEQITELPVPVSSSSDAHMAADEQGAHMSRTLLRRCPCGLVFKNLSGNPLE